MSTSTDTGELSTVSPLHENAIKVLLYLKEDAEGETASTMDIRDATELSAANISGNHAKKLLEKGWIEKTGTQESGAPQDANVYTLTHIGRKEANKLLERHAPPMSDAKQRRLIQELRDRVAELEEQVEESNGGGEAQETIDTDLEAQVGSNTEKIMEHESTLETVHKILEKHLL